MKKLFIPFIFFLAINPANANGLRMKTVNSVQLTVDNALTNSTRGASSYSLTTNGVTASSLGGLTLGNNATSATLSAPTIAQTTAGQPTSVQMSFTLGDNVNAVNAGVDVSSDGLLVDLPAFSNVVSQSGGVKSTLAGTVSGTTAAVVAGGAGTSAIASISTELTVGDW
tara:strand:- start:1254 stop:1760 length:507 start_codon:yes stop_codon:yes gene_type:complete